MEEVTDKQQVFIKFLKKIVERAESGGLQLESLTMKNEEHMEIMSGAKNTTSIITINTRSKTEN